MSGAYRAVFAGIRRCKTVRLLLHNHGARGGGMLACRVSTMLATSSAPTRSSVRCSAAEKSAYTCHARGASHHQQDDGAEGGRNNDRCRAVSNLERAGLGCRGLPSFGLPFPVAAVQDQDLHTDTMTPYVRFKAAQDQQEQEPP